MTDKQQLLEMGFESERVEWALVATGGRGLQPAMDHILANMEKQVPDFKSGTSSSSGGGGNEYDAEDEAALNDMFSKKGQAAQDDMVSSVGEAQSLKCDDCGRILKNAAFASFHAEKSGHTNFSESTEAIKPLTEEEKKARLEELRTRLAEKRKVKSKEDQEEAKSNELIRRKAGKDLTEAKEDMKRKEMLRDAERKKQEKIEDAQAKARIKAQIEADKKERAARTARERALRDGTLQSDTIPVKVAAPSAAMSGASASSASEARLRVRAPEGTWTGTLSADATLEEVESQVLAAGKSNGPIQFSTSFPRRVFTESEKKETLRALGLIPSAALEAKAA